MDIGTLTGTVLVFGGPYSNFQATTALLEEARRRGISPENIICTGDIVAYCADAKATVDAIRASSIHVVMGNCEESLGDERDDCGCGFEEGSACDVLSAQWFSHASKVVDNDAKRWMAELPRRLTFNLGGRKLAVIHGGGQEIGHFIFNSTPDEEKYREIEQLDVEGIIAGHCGLPFTENLKGRLWHNAGVIGMPANDGTPRTWYATLTPAGGGIVIEHHPLAYDHFQAAQQMRHLKLPAVYAETLENGLWPNMDVLPVAEQTLCGTPLTPEPFFWSKA